MRIAVVDPYGRSIKFLDERGSPEVFSQRHVGRGKKVEWSMVAPGLEEGDPGLGVAMDQDGLRMIKEAIRAIKRKPLALEESRARRSTAMRRVSTLPKAKRNSTP
jgi:hypothetical protein